MVLSFIKNTVLIFVLAASSCGSDVQSKNESITVHNDESIVVGANRTDKFLPLLNGKKVGIVANQTSVIFNNYSNVHLVDSLNSLNIDITKVFAPEHGFRGKADAGEQVVDGVDIKTGLPILSLYGKNKKPSQEQLLDIDIMIFDIQDVGARFYTYISTLHYVMEACAENNIPVVILDRPNPNGHYVDGPILEMEHKSFVGMHTIPVVHGMTIGEYSKMINGEQWLENGIQCDITVVPVKNYTHATRYALPIKPSPNLPNDKAINLYPSLCFFEGTNVSVGRGTDMQFQIIGSPLLSYYSFAFTPQPNEGSKYPKHEGKTCSGKNLQNTKNFNELNLGWLIEFYDSHKQLAPNEPFFNDFFTKLAGTRNLQKQIEKGLTETEIKSSWQKDLKAFKNLRKKYLIYD